MRVSVTGAVSFLVLIVVAAFLVANLATIAYYGSASLDRVGTITELPGWTGARVVSHLRDVHRMLNESVPRRTVISDSPDPVSAERFEAAQFVGSPLLFFSPLATYSNDESMTNLGEVWSRPLLTGSFRATMDRLFTAHNRFYVPRTIRDVTAPGNLVFDTVFVDSRIEDAASKPNTLLLESFNWTLFNNWQNPGQPTGRFTIEPYRSVRNFLIYVPSKRAVDPTSIVQTSTMIWRREPDVYDPQKSWEAIGRYLLFDVVNPTKRFRVEIDYTGTPLKDGRSAIPPASVLGSTRVRFPGAGVYGAGRLLSPPLSAQRVGNDFFIELDMGRDGERFPDSRVGLMTWFGKSFPFDRRHIVGFMRDISIIPQEQAPFLNAPSSISRFPVDLENGDLEFWGLYEDGWVANRATVWLAAPRAAQSTLVLQAAIPAQALSLHVDVQLRLDGRIVASVRPASAELQLYVPASGDGRRHEVTVEAGPMFHLPGGDDRPATIKLEYLGFE